MMAAVEKVQSSMFKVQNKSGTIKARHSGFSLIELMVAMGIIGLVVGVSLASVSTIQKNTRDAQRQTDLRALQGALQRFYADQNFYPNTLTLTGGAELNNCTGTTTCTVSKKYLSSTPKDPTQGTTTPYCYISLISSTSSTSCASANPGACHFYRLYANLENPGGSPQSYTCGSQNSYDFEVTPL